MVRTRRATCASCSSTPVGMPSTPVRIPSTPVGIPSAVSGGETSDGDSIAERARACRISSTSASLKPCRATANGRHSTSRYSASRSRESTNGMRPPSMASSIRAGGASEERPMRALTTTLVSTTATRRSKRTVSAAPLTALPPIGAHLFHGELLRLPAIQSRPDPGLLNQFLRTIAGFDTAGLEAFVDKRGHGYAAPRRGLLDGPLPLLAQSDCQAWHLVLSNSLIHPRLHCGACVLLWCMCAYMHRCLCTIPPCLLYTSPSPRDGLLSRMPS